MVITTQRLNNFQGLVGSNTILGVSNLQKKAILKRRLSKDESAVSEVVGTILILAITVVLFTTIYASVSTLEAPESVTHLNMTAQMVERPETIQLNIEHKGGNSIHTDGLTIRLVSFQETETLQKRYGVDDLDVTGDENFWDIGQYVSINVTDLPGDWGYSSGLEGWVELKESVSFLTIIIYNQHQLVWEGEVLISDIANRPHFVNSGIVYPQAWENFVKRGGTISFYARVRFPPGSGNQHVLIDLNHLRMDHEDSAWGSGIWNMTKTQGGVYVTEEIRISNEQRLDAYWISAYAHTGDETETKDFIDKILDDDLPSQGEPVFWARDYIPLAVGQQSAALYQPDLVVGEIEFSPQAPSHGQEVTVTASIYNNGRYNYTAGWEITDDGTVVGEGTTTFRRGPAPTRISITYNVHSHGPRSIRVMVDTTLIRDDGVTDEDVSPSDNQRSVTMHVDPYVMLVRDTLHGNSREGRIMINELRGLNLGFDSWDIYGEEVIPTLEDLERGSVVIWMTGNETEHLTDAHNVVNEFIDNGGAFWLIGSALPNIDDLGELGGKLGYDVSFSTVMDSETLLEPGGMNGTYGRFNYTVRGGVDYRTMTTKPGVPDSNTLIDMYSNIYGIGYEVGDRNRTAVNSFLYGNIEDPGQRSCMASEVIRWITNMTTRGAVDVAVSSQRIYPANPMFMDDVVITATIRNNGPEVLYVTSRCERNGGEELLRPNEGDYRELEANGGTETITFTWTATILGVHEFIVIADYYREINEVTRENNDIRYKDLEVSEDRIQINVHYSTLLVDATHSEHFGHHNVTEEIEYSFIRLGHEKGVDYDYFLVEQDGDGPSIDIMSEYNAVFWITGEREEAFTEDDIENLMTYVNQDRGANLMLMGEHILEYLRDQDEIDFVERLGIEPNSIGELGYGTSDLIGQKGNPLSHGLEYRTERMTSLYTFDPVPGDQHAAVLFKDHHGANLASIRDDGTSKVVYMGVNLNRLSSPLIAGRNYDDWAGGVALSSEEAKNEFIYTTLWQFGQRDERAELRVVHHDIEFSSQHPHTGRAYEIRAEIQNIGYRGTTVLIRVREGDNYIGSETAFIEGSVRTSAEESTYFNVKPGTATIEITWRPSHAGSRHVRVSVDPLRRTQEISQDGKESVDDKLMEFNNQAAVNIPVYYFFDDMERGAAKWRHDATLLNIEGVGPLNFIDHADVNTHVKGDWDWSLSGSTTVRDIVNLDGDGVYLTDDPEIRHNTKSAAYSAPRAYWMPETQGDPGLRDRAPLDLVLVFDDGATMADDLDDVVAAAEAAIDMLSPGDRVSVINFGPGASVHVQLSMDHADAFIGEEDPDGDKETIKGHLPTHTTAQQKSLLSGSSVAVEMLDDHGRDDAVKAIITLTDGLSNQDADNYKYAPGGGSGDETDEIGAAQWYDGPDGQKGLLGIPYNIMTITISDSIEPRHHWVSATSTADVSYGILERDAEKLTKIYQMFVMDLMQSEQGELRSIPGQDIIPLRYDEYKNSPFNTFEVVEDIEFFVFSDAFTTGHFADDVDYYDWEHPSYPGYGVPGHGHYDVFDFDYVEERFGKTGPQPDDWVVVESNTQGSRILTTVYPKDTLDELQGSYVVKEAYANMYVDTSGSASLTLRINDGEFEQTGITGNGDYINIPLGFSHAEPFTFELIHAGPDGQNIILDDLSFTYEIDYYPGVDEDYGPIDSFNKYRYLTTPPVELGDMDDFQGATLEFQNKYKLTQGTSGGFIYMWGANDEIWSWEQDNRLYVEPVKSYTGNLHFGRVAEEINTGGLMITEESNGLIDARDNVPYWGYNGISAGQSFGWTHELVDIGQYREFLEEFEKIRFVFVLAQFGGVTEEDGWGSEMGWYLDDIQFKVSSAWNPEGPGYWNLVSASQLEDEMGITPNENYHDRTLGTEEGHYWIFTTVDGGQDRLPQGVDSSLYTSSISLSNAVNPELTAYIRFNLDENEQQPPDGFRVEISSDDGRSWAPLTSGRRSGWGASGDAGYYSGETEDGSDYGWVSSQSLLRLNTDLSAWRGRNVIIRFRVFTNFHDNYADNNLPKAIFIDDVMVQERGVSTFGMGTIMEEYAPLDTQEVLLLDEEGAYHYDHVSEAYYDDTAPTPRSTPYHELSRTEGVSMSAAKSQSKYEAIDVKADRIPEVN